MTGKMKCEKIENAHNQIDYVGVNDIDSQAKDVFYRLNPIGLFYNPKEHFENTPAEIQANELPNIVISQSNSLLGKAYLNRKNQNIIGLRIDQKGISELCEIVSKNISVFCGMAGGGCVSPTNIDEVMERVSYENEQRLISKLHILIPQKSGGISHHITTIKESAKV